MDTLVRTAENVQAQRNTLSFRWGKIRAPRCAQCRSSMVVARCEPDFDNSMMATYRCTDCGLLDRARIN
jgi:hypothetical protein